MNGERDVPVRERRQSGFGHDVLAVFQDLAGKTSQEKSQGLFLRFFIGESYHDHGGIPLRNWLGNYVPILPENLGQRRLRCQRTPRMPYLLFALTQSRLHIERHSTDQTGP
jgi:hypothetical protein